MLEQKQFFYSMNIVSYSTFIDDVLTQLLHADHLRELCDQHFNDIHTA